MTEAPTTEPMAMPAIAPPDRPPLPPSAAGAGDGVGVVVGSGSGSGSGSVALKHGIVVLNLAAVTYTMSALAVAPLAVSNLVLLCGHEGQPLFSSLFFFFCFFFSSWVSFLFPTTTGELHKLTGVDAHTHRRVGIL